MAQQLSASIYRVNTADLKNPFGGAQTAGKTMGFPTQGIRIESVQGTVTANGITMLTIIKLLPHGLNQPEKDFYSPTATATVITAANA